MIALKFYSLILNNFYIQINFYNKNKKQRLNIFNNVSYVTIKKKKKKISLSNKINLIKKKEVIQN